MPKVNDNYVNNSVMFPREDNYYRGNEIVWKRGQDGNSVERTNNNSILDTREYCVEFDDEDVSKHMENVIE